MYSLNKLIVLLFLHKCHLVQMPLLFFVHQRLHITSQYSHSFCDISSLVLTTFIRIVTWGSLWGTKRRSMSWKGILKRSFLTMLLKKKPPTWKALFSLDWGLVFDVGDHIFWTTKELQEPWVIPNERDSLWCNKFSVAKNRRVVL